MARWTTCFPRLPPAPLAVGQQWTDSAGLDLRRLADSVAGRRVVQRLVLRWHGKTDHATVRGDTTDIAARQVTVEEGRVDWAPGSGLLRRVRHIVVETSLPAGKLVRQPLRSRLVQEVNVVRVGGGCEGRRGEQ